MKTEIYKVSCVALVAALVLAFDSSGLGANTCPSVKPVVVERVMPHEETVSARDAQVLVTLSLLRGLAPAVPSTLRLKVDAVDVTALASIGVSEDTPASEASISYRPRTPLTPGKHHAQIEFSDQKGARTCFTWPFYIGGKT